MADGVTEAPAEAILELVTQFDRCIHGHCQRRPVDRDTVFEIINALAVTVARTLVDIDMDPEAVAFFREAYARQVSVFRHGRGAVGHG